MRISAGWMALLLGVQLHAQDTLPPATEAGHWLPIQFSLVNFYEEENRELGISGDGLLHSNALNLPFTRSLLANRFIDDELKQQSAENLAEKNVLLNGYDVRVFGQWEQERLLFQSPALYGIDYSFGTVNSARFTDDLFNTVFFGNAFYRGETADFSGSESYNYSYDRVGFYFMKSLARKNSQWQLGSRLSLLNLKDVIIFDLQHGTLFTEENGEYLDAVYRFDYLAADSGNGGLFETDGWGMLLDAMAAWFSANKKTMVAMYINQLGAGFLNGKTRTYRADTSLRYEGIQADNLFDFGNDAFIDYQLDSLIKYTGTTVETGSRSVWLPVSVSAVYEKKIRTNFRVQGGAQFYPYPDLLPVFFIKPRWELLPQWEVSAMASYGGTTRYALGVDTRFRLLDHWKFLAGTDNILGLFIKNETTSASLNLRIAYVF
jgi:hypothetical protein